MNDHDNVERALARWFEAEAAAPAPADRFRHAIDTTRARRPRSAVLAGVGSAWVDAGFWGSAAMKTLIGVGLAAAIVVVNVVGLQPSGGSGGGGQSATVPPSLALSPTTAPSASTLGCTGRPGFHPPEVALPDVGFIGLPPVGETPTSPSIVELVQCYALSKGNSKPPYQGGAWLFADGRLVWLEYLGFHGELGSTGYLEQRLTSLGVELLRDHPDSAAKHPLRIAEWMPAGGWADQTVRPYVARGFAICVGVEAGTAGPAARPPDLTSRLGMLPEAAADLLHDKALVPLYVGDIAYIEDCPGLTTAEARELDGILDVAGLEQDERLNRSLLEYHVDLDYPGRGGQRVVVYFEPILPDGRYSCSHCG